MGSGSPKKVTFGKPLEDKNQKPVGSITFDESTWTTLLGLVNFFDLFVPVTQTALWQRHIACKSLLCVRHVCRSARSHFLC